jgi:hypothetical protein
MSWEDVGNTKDISWYKENEIFYVLRDMVVGFYHKVRTPFGERVILCSPDGCYYCNHNGEKSTVFALFIVLVNGQYKLLSCSLALAYAIYRVIRENNCRNLWDVGFRIVNNGIAPIFTRSEDAVEYAKRIPAFLKEEAGVPAFNELIRPYIKEEIEAVLNGKSPRRYTPIFKEV